jgi:CRISPR-associated endonuclease/helicase Cas3
MIYAHTPNDAGNWDGLNKHLLEVADRARAFGSKWGGGDLACWLGLWHDLGKCNPAFQGYLYAQQAGRAHPKVPHAIWGAALAYYHLWQRNKIRELWKEIALPICGHHTQLADGGEIAPILAKFLRDYPEAIEIMERFRAGLPRPPALPRWQLTPHDRELRIRMAFSALIDADYLATEKHFQPDQASVRGRWPQIAELCARLEAASIVELDSAEQRRVRLKQLRDAIYEDCRAAAIKPQGVYRLTVPTGGGKTRSGLAFALRHAAHHCLDRVIIAIPYTSIIDQTAQVYRRLLGEDAVLEHHSQLLIPETEDQDSLTVRRRLATENWDAPIIVTTTVQLFESLLGNRPGRVRKLHNLARSVILLDEVQTLPVGVLKPTLDILRALVEQYSVTVVLSTATQPALDNQRFLEPFQNMAIPQIVPGYLQHFQELRRVRYERWPEPLSIEALAEQIEAHQQILVVLNARQDALELSASLHRRSDLFHLSTLLCGAHRRAILRAIAERLKQGQPVRLVSTQVVEAGVDLDFPTVWRAMGPLDRIVQAAGRCNREWRLPEGRVVVFELAGGRAPRGVYRIASQESRDLLEERGPEALHDPELYHTFFERLFARASADEKQIQELRSEFKYPAVAEGYRLIDKATVPVVVRYGDAFTRLKDWSARPSRLAWQRLQPYLVSIYEWEAQRHLGSGLTQITEGVYCWEGDYDDSLNSAGLADLFADPADLGAGRLVI